MTSSEYPGAIISIILLRSGLGLDNPLSLMSVHSYRYTCSFAASHSHATVLKGILPCPLYFDVRVEYGLFFLFLEEKEREETLDRCEIHCVFHVDK